MTDVSKLTTNEIAQSIGIEKISHSINETLSRETELMIMNVIDTAKILMIYSKRNILTVNDINDSLKTFGLEKVYGYTSMKKEPEMATIHYSQFLDLTFSEDEQLQTSDIASSMIHPYPLLPTFNCNWLIGDHFKFSLIKKSKRKKKREKEKKDASSMMNSNENEIEEEEEDDYEIDNDESTETSIRSKYKSAEIPSKKLKFYFDTSIEGFFYGGSVFEMMLSRMSSDKGFGPLLDFYLDFIESILKSTKFNFETIRRLIKLSKILVLNHSFNMASCSDRIVSIAFSILLIPGISSKSSAFSYDENNILMREDCCQLFQCICDRFDVYNNYLRAQIGEHLLSILENEIDCYIAYGVILSFLSLGIQTNKYVLFPNVEKILLNFQDERNYIGPERHLVFDALIKVVGNGLYRDLFLMYIHNNLQLNASTLGVYSQIINALGIDMKKFCYDTEDSYMFI